MVTTERIIEHMCEKDRSRGRVREKGKTRRGGGGGGNKLVVANRTVDIKVLDLSIH